MDRCTHACMDAPTQASTDGRTDEHIRFNARRDARIPPNVLICFSVALKKLCHL